MILSYGTETYEEFREKRVALPLLRRPGRRRPRRRLRPRRPAVDAGQRLQERRPGLRHRKARAAAARPGRQQQEHHRPAAEEGPGATTRATDEGVLFSLRLEGDRTAPGMQWCPMHEEPLHLIPERFREEVLDSLNAEVAAGRVSQVQITGELCPFCRYVYSERLKQYDGDWTRVVAGRPRQAADPVREGPHRHRHLPAQGREEPGLDRADRRHQLPQDRRVRQRQRSAGVQLRRRVQHRQPRHRRVHRSAQARRGVPLRPARRQPGAQDQAEEVRPDRHRRSDPRPHERAGVSPAAEQRVHGSPPRPHGQDRRSLRHHAGRRDQDLREGLQQGAASSGKHIAPHTIEMAAMWAVLTRLEAAQERRPDAAAEAQALQRQDAARLHRGQRQGAARAGRAARACRASRPRYVQDKISNALVAHPEAKLDQPVHGAERAGGGPASTTR